LTDKEKLFQLAKQKPTILQTAHLHQTPKIDQNKDPHEQTKPQKRNKTTPNTKTQIDWPKKIFLELSIERPVTHA